MSGLLVSEVTEEEISIDDLIRDIGYAVWNLGIFDFKVTEVFQVRGSCNYLVRGLQIETENEFVYCNDCDFILATNKYILSLFLLNSITKIKRIIYNTVKYYEIHLIDGYIIIEEV